MSDLLLELTKRINHRKYPGSLTGDDIKHLRVDMSLINVILKCLKVGDSDDQSKALFFAKTLLFPNNIDIKSQIGLVNEVIKLSLGAEDKIQSSAIWLIPRFKNMVPGYRVMMLNFLKSPSPMVRKCALLNFFDYSNRREYRPLESFEQDAYLTEMQMNGPPIYELRNIAITTIEKKINKKFQKREIATVIPSGEVAYYWDWSCFNLWKESWFRSSF